MENVNPAGDDVERHAYNRLDGVPADSAELVLTMSSYRSQPNRVTSIAGIEPVDSDDNTSRLCDVGARMCSITDLAVEIDISVRKSYATVCIFSMLPKRPN